MADKTLTFKPSAARPAPSTQIKALAWLRSNLFGSWFDTLITLLISAILISFVPDLLKWLFIDATYSGDDAICRINGGACWPFIGDKFQVLMIGVYPQDLAWRPAVSAIALILLAYLTYSNRLRGAVLIAAWFILPIIALFLIRGSFGMQSVDQSSWGGLMLSIMLALVGVIVSIPCGVMLALGRHYGSPVTKVLCVTFIELLRGVPLITILFMASVMMPLFLPAELVINNLLRIQIGMILFSSAYMAEVVRGGLQAILKGQAEASLSLGVSPAKTVAMIIVPQALRHVLPPLVGRCIALFKDTSLVIIVGLLDFLGMIKGAALDTAWLGFQAEAYVFAAFVYWAVCYSLSLYGRKLEQRGPQSNR